MDKETHRKRVQFSIYFGFFGGIFWILTTLVLLILWFWYPGFIWFAALTAIPIITSYTLFLTGGKLLYDLDSPDPLVEDFLEELNTMDLSISDSEDLDDGPE